jgi:hypothetical protein
MILQVILSKCCHRKEISFPRSSVALIEPLDATNSTEPSPSREAASKLSYSRISQYFMEPEGLLSCPSLVPILSQINLVHTSLPISSKFHFISAARRPVARQQIRNMHQWTNWEEMFSTRSVRQLRDATIELLEAVFSMRYVPRCHKQDKSTV